MNQILSFGKNTENGINPVIKFFAFVIIVFAIILIFQGVYNMQLDKKNISIAGTPVLATTQDGSSVVIDIEYKAGIDKIMYYWNNGEEAIIECNGSSKVKQKIPMPIGTNNLNISVVDSNGKMTRYAQKSFIFDDSIDTNKPTIEIVKGSSVGTIKLIITDDKGLKSIQYQWGEDDIMTPEFEQGATNFELELAAKEGERELAVKVVDISDNESIISKTVKGSKKPEVTVKKSGNKLKITVVDEDKIDKIEYEFNEETKVIEGINESEYKFEIELVSGTNYIIVTAHDVDGLTATYKGKCNY